VAIGHTEGVLCHSRQLGGVFELLERVVVADVFEEGLAGKHARGNAHLAFLWNLPDVLTEAVEFDPVELTCRGHTVDSDSKPKERCARLSRPPR